MKRGAYLFDDLVLVSCPEGLLEVLVLCCFAFRHIDEYVRDLEDVIEVRLDTVPPFLDFVLVTRDFKTLAALLEAYHRDVCQSVANELLGIQRTEEGERTGVTLDLIRRK